MNYKIYIMVILALTSGLRAGTPGNGAESGQFLLINDSAAEMGRSSTGIAEVSDRSMSKNPASLGLFSGGSLSITYADQFQDIWNLRFEGALNIRPIGNLGAEIIYLSKGEIPVTTPDFKLTGELLRANDIAFSLGYGRRIFRGLYVGGLVRFVHQTLDDSAGNSVSFDAGALYKGFILKGLSFGLVLQNLGPKIKLGIGKSYFPRIIGFGFRFTAYEKKRLFGLGKVVLFTDSNIRFEGDHDILRFGVENRINFGRKFLFTIRAGVFGRKNTNFFSSLSTGLGIEYQGIRLDYGIRSYGDLGLSNILTFKYLPYE